MMTEWHYQDLSGKQIGPVTADELRQLAEAKSITSETLIRRGDIAEWVSAKRVKGLFDETNKVESNHLFSPIVQRLRSWGSRFTLKANRDTSKTETFPASHSQPGKLTKILVNFLLFILICTSLLSVVLQMRILKTIEGIASNPILNVEPEKSNAHRKQYPLAIPVTITDRRLDVEVQNYELDVNVKNRELDVNVKNHWIISADPIPVEIVR